MSSKKKTVTNQNQQFNNQFQFDPQGMASLHNALKFFGNIVQNPFGDPFFDVARGQINQQAFGLGQRAQSNFLNNSIASGMSGAPSGFFQSGLDRIGRDTGHMQAQGLLNLIMNQGNRQFAAGNALMHPLQTGVSGTSSGTSTTTQSQSGGFLGPLLTLGGGLLAPFTGGASLAIGSALGGAVGGNSNSGGFGTESLGFPGMAGVNSGSNSASSNEWNNASNPGYASSFGWPGYPYLYTQ